MTIYRIDWFESTWRPIDTKLCTWLQPNNPNDTYPRIRYIPYTRTDTKNTFTLIISHHPFACELCLHRCMCVCHVCMRCEYLTIYTRQLPVVCIRQIVKYNINFDSRFVRLCFHVVFVSEKGREEERRKKLTVSFRFVAFCSKHHIIDSMNRVDNLHAEDDTNSTRKQDTTHRWGMPCRLCIIPKRSSLRRWATLESFWGIWIFMKWISGILSYII